MILPVPPDWNWPPGIRVHIGGCISGHDRWPGLDAHTHLTDRFRGWICVINSRLPLTTADGQPSWQLLHELAHARAGHLGHTRTWRRIYTELCPGCPLRSWERSRYAARWTRTRT